MTAPALAALTAEERQALVAEAYGRGKRTPKYRNQRCDCGRHASRKECEYGRTLRTLERLGTVRNIREQVPYELAPSVVLDGRRKPALRYFADYVFEEQRIESCTLPACIGAEPHEVWALRVVDVKSPATRRTAIYRAKKHLLKALYGIEVTEA